MDPKNNLTAMQHHLDDTCCNISSSTAGPSFFPFQSADPAGRYGTGDGDE